MTQTLAEQFENDPNKYALPQPLRDQILTALREREVMREASLRLANAADCYGVQHLDTDDLDEYAEELQEATLAVRAALQGGE